MCPQFLIVTKKSIGGGAPILETFAKHKLIKLGWNFIVSTLDYYSSHNS